MRSIPSLLLLLGIGTTCVSCMPYEHTLARRAYSMGQKTFDEVYAVKGICMWSQPGMRMSDQGFQQCIKWCKTQPNSEGADVSDFHPNY